MVKAEKDIIEDVIKYLKQQFNSDPTGHDFQHLIRVYNMAKKLSRGIKVNHFVMALSALLHDVDDFKFRKPGSDELQNTKQILSKYKINDKMKNQIYGIVSHVSYKGAPGHLAMQKTKEGKIVQDADRLDAIGAIGIARCFAYNGSRGYQIYNPEIVAKRNLTSRQYIKLSVGQGLNQTAINHFYDKLLRLKKLLNTRQAKAIAQKRHEFLQIYLAEFFREIKECA